MRVTLLHFGLAQLSANPRFLGVERQTDELKGEEESAGKNEK